MSRGTGLDRRGARAAWLLPAAGLVSALALVAAALLAMDDPEGRGRARLLREASEAVETLLALDSAWATDFERLLPYLVEPWTWEGAFAGATPATPVELVREESGSAVVFDVLLGEADRLERAGDGAGALDAVLEALDKPVGPARRAAGRLRAIQLAATAGAPDVARAQWERASDELSGVETRDGRSWLLLCGLAAAPAVDDATRAAIGARLADAWTSDALPDGAGPARVEAGGVRVAGDDAAATRDVPGVEAAPTLAGRLVDPSVVEDPLRVALRGRVRALLDDDPARRVALDAHARRQRARAVADALGGMPAAYQDSWRCVPVGAAWLAVRRDGDDHITAGLLRTDLLARDWTLDVVPRALGSQGFTIAAPGAVPSPPARSVTGGLRLFDGALPCELVHADPEARMAEIAGIAGGVRLALLVAALFSLVASLVTARALRREGRLARLRSAFVASVSHELRTPVAAVLLMSENLVSGRAGEASRERYHALIHREAQRLRRLVDDVLDVSRLERGRPPTLRLEEIDAAAWRDELLRDARATCAEAGVRCDAACGALPPTLVLDPEAVRRALLNLVDNALKHGRPARRDGATDEPDVELRVEVAETRLRIAVRDHGPGLPRGRRRVLFQPFERGRDDPSGPPGTGLGLAIVRAIVEAHGGTARAEDARPGARFVLDLPLDAASATPHGDLP